MHVVTLPLTQTDLQRAMKRAEIAVLQGAAMLTALFGSGPIARALKAVIVALLRAHAADVRNVIYLQTWLIMRPRRRRRATTHPCAAPPGCRARVRGLVSPRAFDRRAFRGAGLASRDPRALAAAILAVIANARFWMLRVARLLCRGRFKRGEYLVGAPFIRIRSSCAARPAPAFADSS